jgi:hypothetical protein
VYEQKNALEAESKCGSIDRLGIIVSCIHSSEKTDLAATSYSDGVNVTKKSRSILHGRSGFIIAI